MSAENSFASCDCFAFGYLVKYLNANVREPFVQNVHDHVAHSVDACIEAGQCSPVYESRMQDISQRVLIPLFKGFLVETADHSNVRLSAFCHTSKLKASSSQAKPDESISIFKDAPNWFGISIAHPSYLSDIGAALVLASGAYSLFCVLHRLG